MRTLLTLMLIVAGTSNMAQCGMSTTITANPICGNGTITVITNGGTGPYTIAVEAHQYQSVWSSAATYLFDVDGLLVNHSFGMYLDRHDQVRVTVSDWNGCIATSTAAPWQPTYQQSASLSPYLDCATGLSTLEFTALDMGSPPPDVSSWQYTLDGSPYPLFLPDWSLVPGSSPARYRYNNGVVPGPHTMATPGHNSPTYYYCGVYLQASTSQPVSPGDCGSNIALRAALQGALPAGTLMSDSLRTHGLIPLAEPYSSLGYSYAGISPGASIAPSLLTVTGNNAIVDWVIVELRNSAAPAQVIFSRPALLQRDGDVMDLDGDGYVNFPSASGNYFVALRHRNHLGVMTSTVRLLGVIPLTVDFRNASTACYGTSARAAVGSVQCLWVGDATGNGAVRYTGTGNDRDPIILTVGGSTPNNTVSNVYDRRDTNLDGVIKYTGTANDRDIILTNVGSTTPNNTRTQQLP